MRFVISSSPAALAEAVRVTASATVEAEYGDTVVEGSVLTLAHHGPRSARPCPGILPNLPELGIQIVGLSHVDLDTIGGCMAILGCKGASMLEDDFWAVAALVDIKGPHKFEECLRGRESVRRCIQAFWAWSEANRVVAPREEVADVTDKVMAAIDVVRDILGGVGDLLVKGDEWAASKASLDQGSFVERIGDVLLRQAPAFVNHLYRDGLGVVALNTATGAVTVSLADPIEGKSCGDFVRSLWGDLAGGHKGIGGGPRDRKFSLEEAREAAVKFSLYIRG